MHLFGNWFAASLVILLIGTAFTDTAFIETAASADEPVAAEPPARQTTAPDEVQQSRDQQTTHEPTADQTATSDQASSPAKQPKLTHGVFRFHTYPAAWTAAQKTNRPILIYVTSQGCPYCVKMVEQTYQRKQVTKFVADSFETVYVERHLQPKLIEKMRIKLYPTTILVSPNNQVMDVIEGYVDHRAFSQRLQVRLTALNAANSLAGVQSPPRK